ncbi:MAG: Gldg family protein [Mariprofundus sp.]|nr:Gldg family protein [Mariprofundus sp.]
MKSQKLFAPLGLLSIILMLAGWMVYSVTGEMGSAAVSLVWIGLLLLLLFFYMFFPEIRDFITRRSTKYAMNTAIMSLIFIVIVGMVGMMSIKYKIRADLTTDSRYTLSSQTIKILKSLKDDVEVIAFYRSDERTRQAMFDLLQEYSYYTPKFKVRFVDPDRSPTEAVKYRVSSYRTTLMRFGGKEEVVVTESENKITNALIKLLSQEKKVIYFVKGHGEKQVSSKKGDGYFLVKQAIERENHDVKELLLLNAAKVPEDASVLVISGPGTNFLQAELDKLSGFINQGGRVMFMLDPGGANGLVTYLADLGFEVGNDLIIDTLSQVYGANYLTPVVVNYHKKHPITNGFELATFFPAARSVHIKEDAAKGRYDLAKTSDKSWTVKGELTEADLKFNADKHTQGPISVAAVAAVEVLLNEKKTATSQENMKTWGKVVVVGDSDLVSNTHLKLAGNKDFFLNMLNWLAEENVLISIRRKEPGLTPLMLTRAQGKIVFWCSMVIVPSLVLVVGIGVTLRRRRSA